MTSQEKKHRKKACRTWRLKMSFGKYQHRDQEWRYKYVVKTARSQAEDSFKKSVVSNMKYLSESKENKGHKLFTPSSTHSSSLIVFSRVQWGWKKGEPYFFIVKMEWVDKKWKQWKSLFKILIINGNIKK